MSALLLAVVLAAAPEVEAQLLDGRTLFGRLTEIGAAEVALDTPDGPITLETAKLMALRPKEKPPSPGEKAAAWVELTDGSSLLGRQYTVENGRAKVTLLDGRVVEMTTAEVAHVRLQEQSDTTAQEWARILDKRSAGDLLVVRTGDAIDYHGGVVGDVTDDVVKSQLDGDSVEVKRTKVHGIVYGRAADRELPKPICRLTDAGGSQWSVQTISLAEQLKWTTPAGVTVSCPLAEVAHVDFSGGKIVFLSDLPPESMEFTPYFGASQDLPMLAKFFGPRNDKNLESGPLQVDGKRYAKGLALHSRTKLVYRLPDRFRRFQAVVGIDDGVRPGGHVQLVVHGDDRVLLELTVTGTDPPKPIDLDITGVRRLSILVDFGDQLDVGDHLDLCEARITK